MQRPSSMFGLVRELVGVVVRNVDVDVDDEKS